MADSIIKKHPTLSIIGDGSKVKCSLTGHEMNADEAVVQTYINGKKYKKALIEAEFDYSQYEPHLVPSNKRQSQHQLFCKLTWRHLNKQPDHVLRHVKGKRYQKALKKWQECQASGTVFRPRGGQKPRPQEAKESWESDGNESDAESSDMDDLYPDLPTSQDQDDLEDNTAVVGASASSSVGKSKTKAKVKVKTDENENDSDSEIDNESDDFVDMSSGDDLETNTKTHSNTEKSSGKRNRKMDKTKNTGEKRKKRMKQQHGQKKKKLKKNVSDG